MRTLTWLSLPAVAHGLLLARLDGPARGRDPRGRARERVGEVLARLVRRVRRVPPPPPEPDPFVVLALQVRLGVLAAQVRALEEDSTVWARARRLEATRAAYDDLLGEACRLAGIEVGERPPKAEPRSEPERFREEVALAERGWSW